MGPSARDAWIAAALRPRSIAIVGASADPEKIGGRPIKYMLRHGYRGKLYPVNPQRGEVQGLKTWPDLEALPEAPELAVIAVPGGGALAAVEACARRGVKVAVVITSGFAETGEQGRAAQEAMVRAARAAGMRLVGPNTQGLVNFQCGAIASFATLIGEIEPADGAVAVVSQSGAMSMVPYAFLRTRGIGVRHSHATGNEADLTVADFTRAVALDSGVKLILLYLESLSDPGTLETAAMTARGNGVPIVALKAGVSARGQAAASSHTGALATEDRVVDAFFEKLGIWRVPDMRSLCNAASLYLRGWKPRGRRVVAISNSGASCVMAADAAERFGVEMPQLAPGVQAELGRVLPSFAAGANPIDLTAALLTDSGLLGKALGVLQAHDASDACFVSLPMSGKGYDTPRFATDVARWSAASGKPVVLSSPLESTRRTFENEGVPAYEHDVDAMSALAQVLRHHELLGRVSRFTSQISPGASISGTARFLSEAESLGLLARHGIPVIPHKLCRSPEEALAAFDGFGVPVALKGCSPDVPHKSEHDLVILEVSSAQALQEGFSRLHEILSRLKASDPGVIVAKMAGGRELMLGARWMPGYGAVVMLGAGGKYVEALGDVACLVHPFCAHDVRAKLMGLRIAPLLAGVRGEAAADLSAYCETAGRLAELVAGEGGAIASVDLNPVFVGPRRKDTVVVDALMEVLRDGSEEEARRAGQ